MNTRSRTIATGLASLATGLVLVAIAKPPGTTGAARLEFDVEAEAAGQLQVYHDRAGAIVDPKWVVPLTAGSRRHVAFPLPPEGVGTVGFKPFSSGAVTLDDVRVVTQHDVRRLDGGFMPMQELEATSPAAGRFRLQAVAGATDPFGVFTGLAVPADRSAPAWTSIATAVAPQLALAVLALVLARAFFGVRIAGPSLASDVSLPELARLPGILALGVIALFLRNAHALVMPVLYTEDGAWMADLFHHGFWHMLVNAKNEGTPYFVFLNILLLQAAKVTNQLFCGDSLALMPQFVSFYATLFLSAVAAAPVYLLRGHLRLEARAMLWALIVFMPLGTSTFEVLGRASNVGFTALFLCFCLLVFRRGQAGAAASRFALVDAGIFLCATTNPLCYPLVAVDFGLQAVHLWRTGRSLRSLVRDDASVRSAAVLCVALGAAAVGMRMIEGHPSPFLREPLRWRRFIEAFAARSFLFPVVFPFYTALDDAIVVGLAATLSGLVWWLTAGSPVERRLVVASGAVFAYAALATIFSRPGLTRILDGYTTTLLDRYYYGTSLFVALNLCAGISAALRSDAAGKRAAGRVCLAALAAIYCGSAASLIEFDRPAWANLPTRTFADAVVTGHAEGGRQVGKGRYYEVKLHPEPWFVLFPAAAVEATVQRLQAPHRTSP